MSTAPQDHALAIALDHLRRHGLVHRDAKPSNIIFVQGIPKLADIGLVVAAESTLSLVGTEGYLPPEVPALLSPTSTAWARSFTKWQPAVTDRNTRNSQRT